MPFGLAIQVQTQEQEDLLIEAWTRGEPIPTNEDGTPKYASRKEFAQAILRKESKDRYVAQKTQRDANATYDASQAAAKAASGPI